MNDEKKDYCVCIIRNMSGAPLQTKHLYGVRSRRYLVSDPFIANILESGLSFEDAYARVSALRTMLLVHTE